MKHHTRVQQEPELLLFREQIYEETQKVKTTNVDIPANMIVLIYPFAGAFGKELVSVQNTMNDWHLDQVVNKKTRFYDYIMNKFSVSSSDGKPHNSALCLSKKQSEFKNTNIFSLNEVGSSNSISCNNLIVTWESCHLYMFDSNMGFLSIFLTIEDNKKGFSELDFWELYTMLKEQAKSVYLHEILCDKIIPKILLDKYRIKFFEDKPIEKVPFHNNQSQTTATTSVVHLKSKDYPKSKVNDCEYNYSNLRAIFFLNLYCKKIKNMPECKIPAWVTGVLPIKKSSIVASIYKKMERTTLVEGNTIDTTLEGCCSLSFIETGIDDIRNYYISNLKVFCQHTFLSYILVLHQMYFLHLITNKAADIAARGKHRNLDLNEIENVEKQYIDFRKNYMYQRISVVEKYQNMYATMQKNTGVLQFSEEAKYTIEPIRDFSIKNMKDEKASILNVLYNTFSRIFNYTTEHKKELWVSIAITIIIAIITIPIVLNVRIRKKKTRKK